jgi:hypothetical protein
MRKILLTALFLFWGAFAVFAQNRPSIKIINNTGFTIYYIFVSPASDEEWGEELLGEDFLEKDESFDAVLPLPLNQVSVYDIRLVDEDGDRYYKWGLTVTNNAWIVFTLDDLDKSDLDF